jgi:hypothetical protein
MNEKQTLPDNIRLAAEQHGLGKALKLFPDGVKGAAERGLKPLGEPPKSNSPIASPAHIFNPARFNRGE